MNDNIIVKKIVDYIEDNIDRDLSLNNIANALNYSKFYITRVFNEETKCTIYKYIQGRRLTLAAQQLVETSKPIIEIAYEARYNSQQAFTLAFHQVYQCTPQTYRRNGFFYPKQLRLNMIKASYGRLSEQCYMGGRSAA